MKQPSKQVLYTYSITRMENFRSTHRLQKIIIALKFSKGVPVKNLFDFLNKSTVIISRFFYIIKPFVAAREKVFPVVRSVVRPAISNSTTRSHVIIGKFGQFWIDDLVGFFEYIYQIFSLSTIFWREERVTRACTL